VKPSPSEAAARDLALVTGASSGVGVEFARQLAERGYDLIVAARRLDRLEQLKTELEAEHRVAVTVIACDLGLPAGAQALFDEVQRRGLDVTMLINNAGLGKFGPLLEQSVDELQTMIQVNLASLTTLTRLFAETMKARGGGYILNNASYSALQPVPHYAVYSATKAYVLAFSQAARHDLRPYKIRVSALCPGFFGSDFFELARQKPSPLVRLITLDRRHVARAGIRGVLRGKTIIVPGVLYKIGGLLTRLLPRATVTALGQYVVQH
jgi:hypothetical protein